MLVQEVSDFFVVLVLISADIKTVGPLFQSPLIALQGGIDPRDIATATAAFGFVRNIGTSISVVVGGAILQNEISKHRAILEASLPPAVAGALTGGSAGSSIGVVNSLSAGPKRVAQDVYGESLWPMWTFYVALCGVAIIAAFFIKQKDLSRNHKETETGLEAEKERRAAFQAMKEEKAAKKSPQSDRHGWSTSEEDSTASEAEKIGDDRV